jgi:2-oxoglutarate ferredoxin oxidoreductase subunit delta
MAEMTVNELYCKGCGLCVDACPKHIIAFAGHLNSQGYYPAVCTDQSACTACTLCYVTCPDGAITITK